MSYASKKKVLEELYERINSLNRKVKNVCLYSRNFEGKLYQQNSYLWNVIKKLLYGFHRFNEHQTEKEKHQILNNYTLSYIKKLVVKADVLSKTFEERQNVYQDKNFLSGLKEIASFVFEISGEDASQLLKQLEEK